MLISREELAQLAEFHRAKAVEARDDARRKQARADELERILVELDPDITAVDVTPIDAEAGVGAPEDAQ